MAPGKKLAFHGQIIGIVQHSRTDRHHILVVTLVNQIGATLIAESPLYLGRAAISGQAGIAGKAVAVPRGGCGGPGCASQTATIIIVTGQNLSQGSGHGKGDSTAMAPPVKNLTSCG